MNSPFLVVFVFGLWCAMMVDAKPSSSDSDAGGSSASKAAPCGQSNSQSNGGRLMGGQPTLPNEFPWQVYIEPGFVWSSVDPACPVSFSMFWETSGVLLNDQWILTGARAMQWPGVIDPVVCNNVTFGEPIPYPLVNEITLVFGAHNVSEGQNSATEPQRKVVKTWQVFLHPQWNINKTEETLPYDLALIRLPAPITFNDYIRPICLPDASDSDNHIGEIVKLTGWGDHEAIDSASSDGVQPREMELTDVLLQADVLVLSNDQCKPNFPDFNLDDQMVACVGGPNYAATGDDGGPMAYSQDGVNGWTLFGILSMANNGLVNQIPPTDRNSSIGVRVHPHLDWIYSLMNDENLVIPPSPATITAPPTTTPTSPATVPDNGAVLRNSSGSFLWATAVFVFFSAYFVSH